MTQGKGPVSSHPDYVMSIKRIITEESVRPLKHYWLRLQADAQPTIVFHCYKRKAMTLFHLQLSHYYALVGMRDYQINSIWHILEVNAML